MQLLGVCKQIIDRVGKNLGISCKGTRDLWSNKLINLLLNLNPVPLLKRSLTAAFLAAIWAAAGWFIFWPIAKRLAMLWRL